MNRGERRARMSEHRIIKRMSGEWSPFEAREITAEQRERFTCARSASAVFVNNRYVVQIYLRSTEWGEIEHLAIRRNDAEMVRSWSDMQRIKNELCGAERVGLEVFPAESDLVDEANMAHVWVLPSGFSLPFTIRGRW